MRRFPPTAGRAWQNFSPRASEDERLAAGSRTVGVNLRGDYPCSPARRPTLSEAPEPAGVVSDDAGRSSLRADCSQCFGLCCVAPAFSASADFAIDKPAGSACPNLTTDFRCGIHDTLRERGFPGCVAFDCFGAGQKVAQVIFGGQDWRRAPDTAASMFAAFGIMRHLHELLWYLTQAIELRPGATLAAELEAALDRTERLTQAGVDALLALDTAGYRDDVNALLVRTSETIRVKGPDRRGADLTGADLRGADLRRACLRGARLIGADLTRAEFSLADLTAADL